MVCGDVSDFGKYFAENMNAIGLPAPTELFGTATLAYANIRELAEAVGLYGRGITLTEVWGATSKMEKLRLIGPVMAAYYTGAAVGSAAVATGRVLGCGATIADAMWQLREQGIYESWLEAELLSNPQFLNPVR